MDDRPPFDLTRAAFYLVAAILMVHCLVVLAGMVLCVHLSMTVGTFECDSKGRLSDLLSGALAAAIAFASGKVRDK